MPCGLKRPSKVKKLLNKVLNRSKDHVRSPESHSRLPLKHTTLSELGDSNSHEAIPANAKPEKAQHWSSCSSEPKVGTSHENVLPAEEPDQLQHQPGDSKISGVGEPHELIPAITQHGLWPAQGGPGFSERSKLDKALPADAKPSRDLWEEAEKGLSEDDLRRLSTIDKARGYKVVEQVAELTKQSNPEHGKGKVKIAFEAALKLVLTSKDLINSAMECDSTGHAAAAWTLVSFGLQMTQNELDRQQNVLEACELLAGNLRLMAALEDSYRINAVPNQSDLEDNIVLVYRAILQLSVRIVFENTINTGHKILNSFNKLEKQPLQNFKEELTKAQNNLEKWTAIIDQQHHTQLAKNVNSMLAEMVYTARQVSELAERSLTQEENTILDWLSQYPFEKYGATSRQRGSGTGEWILASSCYEAWKKSGDKVMWLHGNSGCGKSFLCSKIIDHLKGLSESEPSYTLAYWYFTDGSLDSLNIDNLLYCLIKQLCAKTRTIPDSVRNLWNERAGAKTPASGRRPEDILDSVVTELHETGHRVLIVLDGLDEYPVTARAGSSGARTVLGREVVLQWLQNFHQHPNVHALVTSRDEDDIRVSFEHAMKLDVAQGVTSDLDSFIKTSINNIVQKKPWKLDYKNQISDRFRDNSERQVRFRWASLVLQTLSECTDKEEMHKALNNLPDSLEGIYADVLNNKIPKTKTKQAKLVLSWLCYSLRPLTLRELACAVDLPHPQDILGICTSYLVSLQPDKAPNIVDRIVKLDHFSVKEYLTSNHLPASPETATFYTAPLMAHLTIAEISVSHLIRTNKINPATVWESSWRSRYRSEIPLLDYSMMWYKHIQRADAIEASAQKSDEERAQDPAEATKLLRDNCHRLLTGEYPTSFKIWLRLSRVYEDIPSSISRSNRSPILMASTMDLSDNVRRLLDHGANVDGDVESAISYSDSTFTSDTAISRPVYGAAIAGSLESLKLLLNKGATLDQSGLDRVVKRNSRYEVEVLTTIMKARPSLGVTDDTMVASAANKNSKEVLNYILDNQKNITKSQLEAIARNYSSHPWILPRRLDVLEKLVSYGKKFECDGNQMLRAFLQPSRTWADSELRILIDRYDPSNSMGQEIVSWALQEDFYGDPQTDGILRHYRRAGVEVVLTPDMEIAKERIEKRREETLGRLRRQLEQLKATIR